MGKNDFIKISATLFVLLAIIISLFPPFKFNTKGEKYINEGGYFFNIYNKLPVKKYDFIFSDNKKYIVLAYYDFFKKFYDKDSVLYYKNIWRDKKFNFNLASTDTFLTASRYLYQIMPNTKIVHKSAVDDLLSNPKNYLPDYNNYGDTTTNNFRYEIEGNRIIKYYNHETNIDAVNYNEVKGKYDKSPYDWNYKYVFNVDSVKKYIEYSITQPVYILLDRSLLFEELVVEYILAFFISVIIGFIIQKFVLSKSVKLMSLLNDF